MAHEVIKIVSSEGKVATKLIDCNACEYVYNFMNEEIKSKLTDEELSDILKAKRNGWKIEKGQTYIRQRGLYLGIPFVSKFIPEINEICHKYGLYKMIPQTN